MKQIDIPKTEETTPDQQLHSCGCYFEGIGSVENKAKRRECKMHSEMPDTVHPLEFNGGKQLNMEGIY